MPDQTTPTTAPEPAYITRRQAAEIAKVNERTIDRWITKGLVKTKSPSILRGRGGIRKLVRTADVMKVIAAAEIAK